MDKSLFGNLLQIEKGHELQGVAEIESMPYYACESKIQLSIDDLFDWQLILNL